MPFAPICWNWREIIRPPLHITGKRLIEQRASRNEITSSPKPPGSQRVQRAGYQAIPRPNWRKTERRQPDKSSASLSSAYFLLRLFHVVFNFLLVFLQKLRGGSFETHYQNRLRIRGANQAPSFLERHAHTVHIDYLMLTPDDVRDPRNDLEFHVIRTIDAQFRRGYQ